MRLKPGTLIFLVGLVTAQNYGFIKCTQGCIRRAKPNNILALYQCQKLCQISADDDTKCEVNGRFVADPEACTSYYECRDGIKFEAEPCPEGTLFDHSSQQCLWAESVQCGKSFNSDLASPRQFNKIYTSCLWQCQLENDAAISVGTYPLVPVRPQSIAIAYDCYARCKDIINDPEPTCLEDKKYRTPNTCSSFYFCSNGIRFPNIECPYGLEFNGTDCDWPSEVDCPIIETNPLKSVFRPCEDGLHQVRGEPSKFYHCFQGVQFEEISCPSGLLFNEELGVCDWPRNVAVLPEVNPLECFDGIYTAWSYGWYWYCYDSQIYYKKCPEPLMFDDVKKTCTWPWEIQIPAEDLEITSQTLSDVSAIRGYLECLWQCTQAQWNWGYWGWSWESNFIPFDKKFRCTRKCARNLGRYSNRGRRDVVTTVHQCKDGKVGVKNSENFFFECLDGIQLPIQKCPDGLQFSEKDQDCVPGYML